MRTIAIPFKRGEFIDFWKIVKVPDELYREVVLSNRGCVRIDGRDKGTIEKILKEEKTRLIKEKWEVSKAKASIKLYQAEKQYWKELSKANNKLGTIIL